MPKTSFISTTIPYVNAKPHLGHALEYVEADSYARHMARSGEDVFFMSGSDENSLKNVIAAERAGVSTKELVDNNVKHFEGLIGALDLRVDHFVRTSVDADHIAGAIEFWRRMQANGDIYLREYEGLYCVGCEQFYSEAELVDGKCPEHFTVPDLVSEANYFFRLSKYQDRLLEALTNGEISVVPGTRLNEVVSFVRGGLSDISISRSVGRARDWGIAVPEDPRQVMYVWIDALTNYVNGLGFVRDDERYRRYWDEADKRIHVVGKGVTRFHAVYWPAMLLSAGVPLPTDIVVHGYITFAGRKISKSLGNSVDPRELIDQYGLNAIRYMLLADFSPFSDGDFDEERLIGKYNTDLANGLGNLVSRATSMVVRYRDGVVPAGGPALEAEKVLADQVLASETASAAAMENYDHREAMTRIWDLVRRSNAYIDERSPWHLAKSTEPADVQLLDTTLQHLAAAVQQLGYLIGPFLPSAGARILATFGITDKDVPPAKDWLQGVAGISVTKPESLFPRIDVKLAEPS
ncbi:methionine--tRNA ligase [Winogradskya humida]|uniref:methionine--tRNA ligase n=1 Tax=Winogradskya humida TaxID=113566 RepID=A0ABQ3ZNT3_9ACTN|nr:class I tRNA ligase family protein [Actinoplanes humidus]GIE20251.1 methionine--tRNA ligase [Actinoplanes humidus]